MDAMTTSFGEVLLWSFWFFIWIAALMVWFRCLWDLFGDRSLGGWAKAGWVVLLIFVPWLGALIYLIAEHKGMQERSLQRAQQQKQQFDSYVRDATGGSASEIAKAKELLDSGSITQEEYEQLKAKALAAA